MNHLTDDELALYAFDPDASANRAEIESHLADCPACQSNLTFIRSVDAGLRDPDAWEIAEDDTSGREAIRRFAADVAAENEEAERLLEGLLANPARTAFANLASKKAYLTAGVVRRLIRAAAEVREREALDALTFADSAIEIAERLTAYPPGVTHDLRGNAWKERAGALTVMGEYGAALQALDCAEREFVLTPGAPLGKAIVQHVRAIVHYSRGDLATAMLLAKESAAEYETLGETNLSMGVRHLAANIAFAKGAIREARSMYADVLAYGESEGGPIWIARESNTLGRCALELGELSMAIDLFNRSLDTFRELQKDAEALRPHWGLALVLLRSGNAEEALSEFLLLRAELHRRAMLADEALIALDLMDSLHCLGRDSECVDIARGVMDAFVHAGMLTSALTAFAYLRDAAHSGTVPPSLTRHVRTFLARLERQPALLFSPFDENL
jgi:tetratricopeptide (TPR) repeat protein